MITCGLDVIKVYNTYVSHQNVCFTLKLKYSHIVGLDTQYLGPHRNMKMRDIAWVSGRNTFITENINTLITEQRNTFDHWSRKILGWRQDFLRWEQLWPEAPILKPSRMSWNSTIIIIIIIVLWTIMITMIFKILKSLNIEAINIPILFWNKGTILTPRAVISTDSKFSDCLMSDCRMLDFLIVGCPIVWLSECVTKFWSLSPTYCHHHNHHCHLHIQHSDCVCGLLWARMEGQICGPLTQNVDGRPQLLSKIFQINPQPIWWMAGFRHFNWIEICSPILAQTWP